MINFYEFDLRLNLLNLKLTNSIIFTNNSISHSNSWELPTVVVSAVTVVNLTNTICKNDTEVLICTASWIHICFITFEIDKDDKGFIKGYDALKSSGLLDILMVGSDKADPLIPMSELSEFKTILTMKQSDTQFNETTAQAFISKQIGRISDLTNATLTPLVKVISKKLDEFPKADLEGKILEFAKNGNFKEV